MFVLGRENSERITEVSGLSLSWNDYDEEVQRFTFGARIDGVWNQHHIDIDEGDEFNAYESAMSLVRGVFGD